MIQERIREIIKQRGLKQKDIYEALGIPRTPFSLFLNGKRNLPVDALEKLFEYLDLEINEKSTK